LKNSGQWFFTADTHFGHANIIKYCKRPFLNRDQLDLCDLINSGTIPHTDLTVTTSVVNAMDDFILHSINSTVDKDDNLVIIGDFCFSKSNQILEITRNYRNRIKCKNVFLVFGNHDHRDACREVFTNCYDNYLFKIDGHLIFTTHYPCRSWDRASHGSWCLYGHVHNKFHPFDNGRLMPYDNAVLQEGFSSILKRHNIHESAIIVNDLLAAVASLNGSELTLDVGVDNVREGVPFGTPWGMIDLRIYMQQKQQAWLLRKNRNYKN